MRLFFFTFVVLLAGCAAKAPMRTFTEELGQAEHCLAVGFYECLTQARSTYESILRSNPAHPGVAERAFDAALLVWIRERELSIPADDALVRARRLLVPSRQSVFDAAQLIVGDTTGLDPEMRARLTGRGRPPLEPDNPLRRALDTAPDTDLAARYVALSIDCEQPRLFEGVNLKALASIYTAADVPLMQFKILTCGRPTDLSIEKFREAHPLFEEAVYWEGRRELTSSLGRAVDFPKVLQLYGQGRRSFPSSLLMTMAWANANLMSEEYEGAFSGFEEVVQKFPEHRDALNGKMQAQSYLMRHPEAVATATRILELGTWNIADANYWRAWNRYHMKEYDLAWVDVENAMKGLSNTRVYMLAGLIAYSRKDLPIAVQRFDTAFKLDSSACDAVWMSGLVSIDQDDLKVAAPKFARGMTCFTSAASALRQDRLRVADSIEKRGSPASAREQRQLDRLERDAANADLKSAQSAFNGAQCYARTGGKGLALNLADFAIDHPEMREKAIALKAAIEKLPQ